MAKAPQLVRVEFRRRPLQAGPSGAGARSLDLPLLSYFLASNSGFSNIGSVSFLFMFRTAED